MLLMNYIAVLGLAFDIVGAYTLAKGIIRKNNERIRLESLTTIEYSPYLITSGVTARLEGRTGFSLMSIGFILQGFQYFAQFQIEIPLSLVILSVAGVVLISFLLWKCVEKCILPEAIVRAKAPMYRNILASLPDSKKLERAGEALKLRRLSIENDHEYWERLCSKIRRYSEERIT